MGLTYNNYSRQDGLPEEVMQVLRNSQNRSLAGSEVYKKLWTNSVKKMGFVYLIIVFVLGYYAFQSPADIKESLITFLVPFVVFTIAFTILCLIDRLRLHTSAYSSGLIIEKAFISSIYMHRGYNLTIFYYDFMQNTISSRRIKVEYSDAGKRDFHTGDFVDVLVKEKNGEVRCVGVL